MFFEKKCGHFFFAFGRDVFGRAIWLVGYENEESCHLSGRKEKKVTRVCWRDVETRQTPLIALVSSRQTFERPLLDRRRLAGTAGDRSIPPGPPCGRGRAACCIIRWAAPRAAARGPLLISADPCRPRNYSSSDVFCFVNGEVLFLTSN